MKTKEAVKILCEAIKEDMDYRRTWHANISMAFQGRCHNDGILLDSGFIKTTADKAADDFINLLCDEHHSVITEY